MTKEPMRLTPADFSHKPAPDSWHEWLQKEEARDRRAGDKAKREAHTDQMEPAHPFSGRMKQDRLTGQWFPV